MALGSNELAEVPLTEPMYSPVGSLRAESAAERPFPPGFFMMGWSTEVGRNPAGGFHRSASWPRLVAALPGSTGAVPALNDAVRPSLPPVISGPEYGLEGVPALVNPAGPAITAAALA